MYEICRSDLEIGQIKLLRNQNNFEKYDLNNSIKDFDELIEEILSQIIGKIIKKLFKNQGKHYIKYQKINLIRG